MITCIPYTCIPYTTTHTLPRFMFPPPTPPLSHPSPPPDLAEGPEGFDLSRGVWRMTGWKEVEELRRKLADLRELRELVRSLGRGGGKGPKRRAPEEVQSSRRPPGVIRSPLVPEETWGLTRSGDLSRMLPSEAHLLAAGWPRGKGQTEVEPVDGNRAARLLHLVRRAERNLMSYERTGRGGVGGLGCEITWIHPCAHGFLWFYFLNPFVYMMLNMRTMLPYPPPVHAPHTHHLYMLTLHIVPNPQTHSGWVDDEPARVTGRMEIRPAAELGPIILCLDTSGSMRGARETVAKALALECLRGAHRQERKCFLYAFRCGWHGRVGNGGCMCVCVYFAELCLLGIFVNLYTCFHICIAVIMYTSTHHLDIPPTKPPYNTTALQHPTPTVPPQPQWPRGCGGIGTHHRCRRPQPPAPVSADELPGWY